MKYEFWDNWLITVLYCFIIFGFTLVFFGESQMFEIMNDEIAQVFQLEQSEKIIKLQAWNSGIIGSMLVSWSVILLYIVRNQFLKRTMWSYKAVVSGIVCWYILDTYISLSSKVYFNGIVNSIILILVLIPLIFLKNILTSNKRIS